MMGTSQNVDGPHDAATAIVRGKIRPMRPRAQYITYTTLSQSPSKVRRLAMPEVELLEVGDHYALRQFLRSEAPR